VVGTDDALAAGIVDLFQANGLRIFGPTQSAARLESSKVFAKEFMERHGIPTAAVYGIYDVAVDAYTALDSVEWPLVIKADGLCAGKGVLVTSSPQEATDFLDRLMEKREFGDAGRRVLLEDGLRGDELSYIVLTDGKDFIAMAPARDHKRAYDNDEGPNTGGMGAYSTDDILPRDLEKRIIDTIVRPTLEGLERDGIAYKGFLYFGLMLTPEGPKVLEYNCRLGDPETEAILLRADFDLAQACMDAAQGKLGNFRARWSSGASVCVVIASEGYPGNPKMGVPISGLDEAAKVPGSVVLHAGTRLVGDTYVTNGGRVLVVSAQGKDLFAACRTAYDAISKIWIEGSHYRKDIGVRKAAKGQAASETSHV
jgi:phosphoribosylamine--glycine ligase